MSDITKCKGIDCPVKEHCHRFTAEAGEFMQSFFSESPGKHTETGRFVCDSYWGEHADKIHYKVTAL
jgi:hypothetical protein